MEERGGVGSGIAGHRRPATIALLWPSAPTPQHQLSTHASRLDPHGCTCSIPLSTWAAISTAVGLPDCSWMALALAARIQRPPLPSLTEEARRVRKLSTFFQIVFPGGVSTCCCSVTTGRPCSSQVVGPQLPTAKVQSWLWPVGDPSMQLGTGGPARAEGGWLCCPKRVRGPVDHPWRGLLAVVERHSPRGFAFGHRPFIPSMGQRTRT